MIKIENLIKLAMEAGHIMTEAEQIERKVESKEGHANFVTEYDSRIQKFLTDQLSRMDADAAFLGEEDGKELFRPEYKKGTLYVIDPIDGTTNFIMGYRLSVVSIGVLQDGKPCQGVICNPYSGECFYAEQGKGAWMCRGEYLMPFVAMGDENTIGAVSLHTSDRPLSESVVLMGTAPYYEELTGQVFQAARTYFQKSMDLRRSGSAAWDLCCVASGRAGLYFEHRLGLWDFTAGAVIVTEAGGKITDMEGKELNFTGSSSVLAVSEGIAGGNEEYLL